MKTFIIRRNDEPKQKVQGETLEIDGMGTRILDEGGRIVFSSPKQLEAYDEASVVTDETDEQE